MARRVGIRNSPLRTQWWDDVLSLAYSIQNIEEIRNHEWRSIIPGANNEERRISWIAYYTQSEAFNLLNELADQILVVAELYDIAIDDALPGPLRDIDTARANLLLLVAEDNSKDETLAGTFSDEDDRPDTIFTGGPGGLDADGDGIPDAADDDFEPPVSTDLENVIEETPTLCGDTNVEVEEMPSCIRDPAAPVQDWSTTDQVFLNPNNCQYYVPVDTGFECPGAEELENRIFSRIGRSTSALFDYLNIGGLDADPDAPLKAQILA